MYVMRNEEGLVVGCFANKQPTVAEEYLKEDHPDIIDFYARLNAHREPVE